VLQLSRGVVQPVGTGLGQAQFGNTFGSAGEKYSSRPYDGVEYTINDMRKLVQDALTREQAPELRKLVESIVAQVDPKDYLSEVAAIYYYVLKNVRYTRDPKHIELVQHPYLSLQPQAWDRAAGRRGSQIDCDELACVIAAMIMVVGNSAEFVTISTSHAQGFHHVFCVAKTQDGQRIVLDPVPGPFTTEMIQQTVRYQAWPIEPVRNARRGGSWMASATPIQGRY